MQTTIGSYKTIIENLQMGDQNSHKILKVEISKMQQSYDHVDSMRNKLVQENQILQDDKSNWLKTIK